MSSFPTIKPGDPQGLVFESLPEPAESLLSRVGLPRPSSLSASATTGNRAPTT